MGSRKGECFLGELDLIKEGLESFIRVGSGVFLEVFGKRVILRKSFLINKGLISVIEGLSKS